MDYTQNLHLPQWEESDRIMMDDFNDAFDKIDAGIAAASAAHVHVGSFVGDGQDNRVISLPFTPKAVILLGYYTGSTSVMNQVAVFTESSCRYILDTNIGDAQQFSIVENGFRLNVAAWQNGAGQTTTYIALQ